MAKFIGYVFYVTEEKVMKREKARVVALYEFLCKGSPMSVEYNSDCQRSPLEAIYDAIGKRFGYTDYYAFEDDIDRLERRGYIAIGVKRTYYTANLVEKEGHYVIEEHGYGYDANGKPKYFDETHGHFASFEEAKAEAARMLQTQENYRTKFSGLDKDYTIYKTA